MTTTTTTTTTKEPTMHTIPDPITAGACAERIGAADLEGVACLVEPDQFVTAGLPADEAEAWADDCNRRLGELCPGVTFVHAHEVGTEQARTPGTRDVSDLLADLYESVIVR